MPAAFPLPSQGDAERLLPRDAVNAAATAIQSFHLDRDYLPIRIDPLQDFKYLEILADPIGGARVALATNRRLVIR